MDQFYFEEGYLEASYFTVIREAAAAFTVTVSQSAAVDIADATGYYIPDYIATGYFEAGGQVKEADAVFTVAFTQTAVIERITQAAATVNVSATNACTVTRIIDSAAAFTAAFAPTLTATAFKNHTAVLDSVSTMSVDAVANRSTNVLLAHIADLNAMAAKTVDVNSNLSHTATQSTTATRTASLTANLASSAQIVCILGEVHSAQSQLTANCSLTTSRYFGKNRPRNIVDYNENPYFNFFNSGVESGQGISTGATSPVIFAGPLSDISPGANESWVLRFAYNNDGTTTARSFFYSFLNGSGSERFLRLATTNTTGTGFQLNLFKTGQSTVTQTFTTSGSVTKIAISYHNGYAAVFLDGQRQALINLTATTGVTWTGFNELIQTRWSLGANTSIDEFHYSRGTFLEYNPQSTSVTATNLQVNSPTTTEVLWHFNGNGLDDISVTESAAAALTSAFTQQTIGSGTFVARSAQAALSSTITLSAQGDKPASATADLSTTSTLSVIIGSVKDSIALNAGVFSVTAQESRLRGVTSSITSAFAPTLTATVTRDGDIELSSVFTMSTTAISFTEATADIAAVFAVNCSPAVDFQAAGSLQSQTNIDVLGGKLQLFQINVNSALAFTVQAIGFEGTGVGLNTVSTLSVTARRLRTVVSAASSTFTQTTVGNNNPAPFEISDYEIFCSGWTFSAETAFSSNSPSSGESLINVVIPKVATNPVPQVVGQISLVNGQGTDTIFAPVTYLSRIGTNLYQAYQKERQHAYTTTSQTDNLSTGTFRSTGVSTTNINQTTGAFTISLDYDGSKGTTNATGPIGSPITLRINGNPNYVMLMSSWFNNPPANTSTLRNVSWEPTGQVYSIPYPLGTSADLRNVTTLIAEATEVVIPNPAVFSTQAQIVANGNGAFRGASNQSSTFSTAINAGKNVEIGSDLASQSTIAVNAVKVTEAVTDLNVAAAQSTANDRLRTTTAALATTVTVSVDAVKTTGVVVNAESAVSQSATAFRIKEGQASFSAFNSQLTAAFKNATGTVLLESVTQMQITAEKNAVGVIALASQFTQSTDSADSKTVRVSSAVAAEFTQTAEGLRIQPASADLSAQFAQSTNTDQSKITRITADFSVSVSQTIQAERRRDGIALQASLGTLTCGIDRLRQANANLVDSFDILASPTFIIRATADFSAFNSQLTVGEIINIDPALQLKIEPETRIRKIPQETRVLSIESETRVNIIED